MKKLLRFSLLLVSFCVAANSAWAQQQGKISAVVQDAVSGEPIMGAVAEYYPVKDTTKIRYEESNAKGQITTAALAYADYKIVISYLGYQNIEKMVKVDKSTVQLGVLKMEEESKMIGEVIATGTAIRASVKGDTIAYNADAYKVTADATAADLIAKMPGIKVEDGKVETQGETIQKAMIDGREFFGDDVATAINNLPAEAISNVEVFTKMSDNAEFSGVGDGAGYKVLNFVTRDNVYRASFGKFTGRYGFNDKYLANVNFSNFRNDRRITVVGFANNMNVLNASSDDILGTMGGGRVYGGGGGVSTTQQFSLNYSNAWKEKVKLDASYSFNNVSRLSLRQQERNYFFGGDTTQFYTSDSRNNAKDYFHNFNAHIQWKMNDKNQLRFRPSFSLQGNSNDGRDTSFTQMSTTAMQNAIVNMFKSMSTGDGTGYNVRNSIQYAHKFGEGHTLVANINGRLGNNDSYSERYSLEKYFDPGNLVPFIDRELKQEIDGKNKSYSYGGDLLYTRPVSEKSFLFARYDISYSYSDNNRISNLWDPILEQYFISDSLSNVYNSGYTVQRVGPGYRFVNSKTNLNIGIDYEYSSRSGEQTRPALAVPLTKVKFQNVVYNANLVHKFNASNTMRVNIRSYTDNPSIQQLQGVLDVSNPLYITNGNPELKTSYSHRGMLNYNRANIEKGRTFNLYLSGSVQGNNITNSLIVADRNNYQVKDEQGNTIVTLNQGASYSRPVNLNGFWSLGGGVDYGAPLKLIRSNVNFNLGAWYNERPGIFNNVLNTTKSMSYNGGVGITSNISTKLDFMIRYNIGYSTASNIQRPQSNDKSLNHFAMARVKWITWKGITLSADANYMLQRGITRDFKNERMMVNASLGKKIFKNQMGEISVAVNDLLNQSTSFNRSVTENYIQTSWTNTIGRFVSLNFVYNLRKFSGARKSGSNETPDTMDRHSMGGGRPPMGGPGGGGRGPF